VAAGAASPGERQLVRTAQGAGQHSQPAQLRLSFFFFFLLPFLFTSLFDCLDGL
jgi:hypothetical protein